MAATKRTAAKRAPAKRAAVKKADDKRPAPWGTKDGRLRGKGAAYKKG